MTALGTAIWTRLFPHRHEYCWESVTMTSVLSGFPVVVEKIGRCACGSEYREITGAGLQQIDTVLLANGRELRNATPETIKWTDESVIWIRGKHVELYKDSGALEEIETPE